MGERNDVEPRVGLQGVGLLRHCRIHQREDVGDGLRILGFQVKTLQIEETMEAEKQLFTALGNDGFHHVGLCGRLGYVGIAA